MGQKTVVFMVCNSKHTGRNSNAAAVQNDETLGKVISLEVRSVTRFLGIGTVGSRYPLTAGGSV
jgi:hypothetical protein